MDLGFTTTLEVFWILGPERPAVARMVSVRSSVLRMLVLPPPVGPTNMRP